MKALITGKNSYIGKSIKSWIESKTNIKVDEIDMINGLWARKDFSQYDTVIHVAGIVHKTQHNIPWETYYEVNSLLPYKVAQKAKNSGVKQFIFISTMAIYGQGKKLPNGNVITNNTPLLPNSYYGKSKLIAEEMLQKISDENFVLSIVRPPNIYGKNCPGNYLAAFIKVVKLTPIFPLAYKNCHQSFLYIDNLTELIRLIIEKKADGIYCPQDDEFISTVNLISYLAQILDRRIIFSTLLGKIVVHLSRSKIIQKIYGGVSYEKSLSESTIGEYRCFTIKEGLKNSVQ